MSRQLTIRGVPDDVAMRLESVSRARGRSVNATVKQILEETLGVDQRLHRLQRYATWSDEEFVAFSEALASQRQIDAERRSHDGHGRVPCDLRLGLHPCAGFALRRSDLTRRSRSGPCAAKWIGISRTRLARLAHAPRAP